MPHYTIPCRWCAVEMTSTSPAKKQYCNACTTAKDNDKRVCVDCKAAFKWNKDPRCSACRWGRAKAAAIKAGKICAECDKPATTTGLCGTHYSYKHRETNPRNIKREGEQRRANPKTKTCEFCQASFATIDDRSRCCSYTCAQRLAYGWSTSKDLVLRRSPERTTRTWMGHTLEPRAGKPLVSGPCAWCGTPYIGAHNATYCSKRCAQGASWKRRYDRRGDFKVPDRVRDAIYTRDGWHCQLCGDPVPQGLPHGHKLYPTLDHIIPQSLSDTPDHTPSNLRLAHLICNAKRGNRMEYDLTV